MKELCHYNEVSPGCFDVIYENGVKLGTLLAGADGYYGFWPNRRTGYWSSHIMREIANKIDKLDEPWDKIVQEDIRI